ncbi:MAG TPA: hypothetical protein GXZ27_04210 [Thermoanaerobacterales bacterium]|nr:hypothetical protein [Thermoanaerobacterales bacterium]
MKNEELLKNLLGLKLQTIDCMLELLPVEIQGHVKQVENRFITILHEITQEYLQKKETNQEKKGLNSIPID